MARVALHAAPVELERRDRAAAEARHAQMDALHARQDGHEVIVDALQVEHHPGRLRRV